MSRIIRSVACAVSGGVDSAVSAYLLKRNGFQVTGVFMTNWDPLDEGVQCSVSADRNDAKLVCERLDIPFLELNFVREYWIYVFQPLLRSYERGCTPNPDVLCNRFVKFNFLVKKLLPVEGNSGSASVGDQRSPPVRLDAIATGHYCQSSFRTRPDGEPCLLRSVDGVKDQTFWLSTISHKHLRHFMFPVGGLVKPVVKQIATDVGLSSIAKRRESMGMCFIGKRRFSEFIDSYIAPKAGLFKDFETGLVLDEHQGIHHFTLGQRATITRATGPFYVSRMDFHTQDIYVVRDPYHSSLFMRRCWTGPAVWINSTPPELPSDQLEFQWQNKWRAIRCKIQPHTHLRQAAAEVHPLGATLPAEYVGSHLIDVIDADCEDNRPVGPYLSIELDEPMRCVAAGQWAALYRGHQCLGGGLICGSVSLWDEGRRQPYIDWNIADYELDYRGLGRQKIRADL
ncbi:hypothetical protein CRM22_009457 [Opisthorchis felineus]|uniref:tRNA-5-taurinomethyluridine 2-sulfurtransferase n=2 Tax=Opisthorchis TaxID=6197 RepID=A0A4S2L6U9_OPIFE|nr:hypothetical protein CRM22_009457 [Opisthorchis felineus]TGZ58745.1 hypothetical protein CRM22_009457 [Opisthorchis felineus]